MSERRYSLWLLAAALLMTIFVGDLFLPLGVAGGVPYVAVILLALWLPLERAAFGLAAAATMLTVLGWTLSPTGGSTGAAATNRAMALLVIWIAAVFVAGSKRNETRRLRDLTILQAARDALLAAEQKYEDLFENAPDMYVSVNASDGTIQECNQTTTDRLGYDRRELIGRPILDMYHPDVRPAAMNAFQEFVEERNVKDRELKLLTKDGRTIDVMLNVSANRDAEGRIVSSRSVWRDVTDIKRTQIALARAQRMASVGTLAAGIAHEINNPLAAILMAAYHIKTLVQQDGGNLPIETALDYLIDDTQRCSRIVKSVQQFAQHEGMEKWPDDPTDAIDASCRLTRADLYSRGATLTVDLPQTIPLAIFSPTEIEQVLVNGIRNAAHAGATQIRITGRTDDQDRMLWIDIEDNGPGLTEEQQRHAFEPFFTTRRSEGGTGLGLSISHGIIAEHGGSTILENRKEGGAVFSFSLPLATKSQLKNMRRDAQRS